ncbi:hypothetical protein [Maribacter polysiphoniae]|uniref:hypothetical protein n=1 Tax=Maribacter polysiphoniae TaxID=429344 RepID=UPI003B5A3BFA
MLRETCLCKVNGKQFSVTYFREEYERNIARVENPQSGYMKGKRQSTVEPGTLTQFMGMRKINTFGLEQANKVMHPRPIANNLKKYLKFIEKRSNSGTGQPTFKVFVKSVVRDLFVALPRNRKFTFQY